MNINSFLIFFYILYIENHDKTGRMIFLKIYYASKYFFFFELLLIASQEILNHSINTAVSQKTFANKVFKIFN